MGNASGKIAWRQLLERTHVKDLLAARPSIKIVTVPATADVRTALQILRQHNILSAPVVNDAADADDAGFVDTLDIISYLTEDAVQDGMREHSLVASGWSPSPARFTASIANVINRSRRNEMLLFSLEASLASVAEAMTRRKLYRVAVYESEQKRTVINILTQSDVVAFVANHCNNPWFAVRADATLDALGFGRRDKMYTCIGSDSTIIALSRLPVLGISAMAVVDETGKFVGQISAAMLRGLGPEHIADLKLSVTEFLKKWSQVSAEKSVAPGTLALREAVQRMHQQHLHRLFVVDKTGKPVGVLSLTDVLSELSNSIL